MLVIRVFNLLTVHCISNNEAMYIIGHLVLIGTLVSKL